jgi:alpha-glucuronidase
MWEEFFDLVEPNTMNAIAGVTNIGTDTNWCGHHFGQANWYAFGRLAWEPTLTSDVIAKEWLQQTFDLKESSLTILSKMMVYSHEAVVDYMMPLGLHHIFAWGHHYGPEPWCAIPGARADWMPSYYHNADEKGLGFDRSSTGSNAVAQYPEELCKLYDNIDTCPEKYILWFHHVPWQHKLQSGRTLWEALCYHYDRGVQLTRDFQKAWDNVKEDIDAERFADVQTKLIAQTRDAIWWKDACLLYFQTFSKLPFPKDYERPIHELDDLKKVQLGITNEECPTIELLNKNR